MFDAIGNPLEVGLTVVVASSCGSYKPYLATVIGFTKHDVKLQMLHSDATFRKSPNYLVVYRT